MATLTGAAYVRTSHDRDDAFSLTSQKKAIQQYALAHNIEIAYYFDEEYTGTGVDRPKLNELMQLVRKKRVQAVIIYDATRLARKVGAAEWLLDRFFESGVQLHLVSWDTYVKNMPRDIQSFYDESVYAHVERLKIIERLNRGKASKLAQGQWLCQGIDKYGYVTVGSKRNQHLEIVPEEANIIRAIYQLFLEGERVPDIADGLQKSGYETPSKAKGFWRASERWSPQMVYSILTEEKYTGRFYANQVTQVISDNGKKSTHLKDRSEWVLMEFPELRIIDDDTFNQAKELLQSRRFIVNPTNEYLINRHIKCGDCGMAMVGSTTKSGGKAYSYYICNSRKSGRKSVSNCGLSTRCSDVDDIVEQFLIDLLQHPDRVLHELQRKQQEQQATHESVLETIHSARHVIQQQESEFKRWAELYTRDDITYQQLLEKKAELDKRSENARQVIQEYEDRIKDKVLTDAEIRDRVRWIKNYAKKLTTNGVLSLSEFREIIEQLGLQIVVGRTGTGSDKKVYVGIAWDGGIQAFYTGNNSVLSGGAMNSTFDRGVKKVQIPHIVAVWTYYVARSTGQKRQHVINSIGV